MSAALGHRVSWRMRHHPVWAPQVLFGLLAVVGTVEGIRLIVAGSTTEARAGGWYLIVVTLTVLCGTLSRTTRTTTDSGTDDGAQASTHSSLPAVADRSALGWSRIAAAIVLLVSAAGYAWALPWFGFAITNFVFLTVNLRWVAHRSWLRTLLYAAICDALFVTGFHLLSVPVPNGVFGLQL